MAIKLRTIMKFPARVVGESGIGVAIANGVFSFFLKFRDFSQAPDTIDTSIQEAIIYQRGVAEDGSQDIYQTIPLLQLVAKKFGGTSTTPNTIGTGAKIFATQEDLAYQDGARIRSSSSADPSNFMEGIAAYAAGTLTINVGKTGGSGSFSDWNFNVAGEPGSGDLLSTNNLSDVADPATARANIGAGDLLSTNNLSDLSNISAARSILGLFKNIKVDYGAKGDGKSVTATVSISSGSPNLTATGASFTAGDVGKLIAVLGAGTSGGILSTTILTYTDATHVVLAANAGTAVSAVPKIITYGTNDTAAINAMTAAFFGKIIWPKGIYCITTLSAVTNDTIWVGEGYRRTILMSFATTGDVVTMAGTSQMSSGIGFRSAVVRTSGATFKHTGNFGVLSDFEILNPYIGYSNTGVLNEIRTGNISDITSRNIAPNSGGVFNSGTILKAINVAVGSGTSVNADMAQFSWRIVNGELDATQCYGFLTDAGLEVSPGASDFVAGVNIKGCWFDSTISQGMHVFGATGSIINYIWSSDSWFSPGIGGGNGYAINIDNSNGGTLNKVFLSNNFAATYNGGNGAGLYVKNTFGTMEMLASNNKFGSSTTGFFYGVQVDGATKGFTFNSNEITGNTTGLSLGVGADDFVIGLNNFRSNTTNVLDSSTPTNAIISNNLGWSPAWKSYTPTLSATGGSITGSASGKYQVLENSSIAFRILISCSVVSGTSIDATLPFAAASNVECIVAGRDNQFGPMLQGHIGPAATKVQITTYANALPNVSVALMVSGIYERA